MLLSGAFPPTFCFAENGKVKERGNLTEEKFDELPKISVGYKRIVF